jgi:putative flippase GtrA
MASKTNLIKQIIQFGIVGVTAALVHFTVVVSLVELYLLRPLIANIAAFLVAFNVSYLGHRNFTFRGTTTRHQVAIPRLFFTSCGLFAANEGLFYFFMNVTKLPYTAALLLVLFILPVVTFMINKLWVFR